MKAKVYRTVQKRDPATILRSQSRDPCGVSFGDIISAIVLFRLQSGVLEVWKFWSAPDKNDIAVPSGVLPPFVRY